MASFAMSAPAKTEPRPFEKFQQFAKKVLSVPKSEIDRREAEYQNHRSSGEKTFQPRSNAKPSAS